MIQTKSETNGLYQYNSAREAFEAAKTDESIYEVLFSFPNGELVRLKKVENHLDVNLWTYREYK